MKTRTPGTPPERTDYGIDAPDVVGRLLMIGTVALVLKFAAPVLVRLLPLSWAVDVLGLARSLGAMGWAFVFSGCVMLWGSRIGKFRLRDRLLAAMPWRGDERVLDVGCGRGLMSAGVAHRLRTGRVVGIDLWRSEDQARNSPEAMLRNMRLEGVGDRVEVRTADACDLPFDAASFDVVVSSWALHHIATPEGRLRAIDEIVRVLRPGGQLAIVDLWHVRRYAERLRAAGFESVQISAPSFLFIVPSRSVLARKPG